jgi:hypothetical protein
MFFRPQPPRPTHPHIHTWTLVCVCCCIKQLGLDTESKVPCPKQPSGSTGLVSLLITKLLTSSLIPLSSRVSSSSIANVSARQWRKRKACIHVLSQSRRGNGSACPQAVGRNCVYRSFKSNSVWTKVQPSVFLKDTSSLGLSELVFTVYLCDLCAVVCFKWSDPSLLRRVTNAGGQLFLLPIAAEVTSRILCSCSYFSFFFSASSACSSSQSFNNFLSLLYEDTDWVAEELGFDSPQRQETYSYSTTAQWRGWVFF